MSYRDDVDTLYTRAMHQDVEELTDNRPGMDEQLRARLYWLASEIALGEK